MNNHVKDVIPLYLCKFAKYFSISQKEKVFSTLSVAKKMIIHSRHEVNAYFVCEQSRLKFAQQHYFSYIELRKMRPEK